VALWRKRMAFIGIFMVILGFFHIDAQFVRADSKKEGDITLVTDEKIEGWATSPGEGNGKGNTITHFDVRINVKGQENKAVSYRTDAVEAPADRNGEKKYTFSLDMAGKWPAAQGETVTYEITVDAYRTLGGGQEDLYFSFPSVPYEYEKENCQSDACLDFTFTSPQNEYAKPPNADAQGRLDVTLTPKGRVDSTVRPPIDVVFVFDVSGSMTPLKLQSAKYALQSAVDYFKANANPNDRFALVPFSDTVVFDKVVPFSAQRDVKEQLDHISRTVNSLTAGGGTNYTQSLQQAQSFFNDPTRKKYIIFLTDGMPTVSVAKELITYTDCEGWWLWKTCKQVTENLDVRYLLYSNGITSSRTIYYPDEPETKTYWDKTTYKEFEEKIRSHGINVAKTLGMNNITLYSIGFGDDQDVDMSYLEKLSAMTGGQAKQGTPQNLTEIFQQFSKLATDPVLSGTVKIPLTSFGGNVQIAETDQVWLDDKKENAYIAFSIPYKVGQPAPPPVTVPIPVRFKEKGEYTFTAELTYRNVHGELQPPLTKSVTVVVKDEVYIKLIRQLTLGNYKQTMEVGETQTIPVTIEPSDATNKTLQWTSSDPDVAAVEDGTVTAVKPGTVEITVKATDGSNVSATATITVLNPYVSLEAISLPQIYMMTVGEKVDITSILTFIPDNATNKNIRSVESSAPEYASVEKEQGRWYIVAKKAGYSTITATAEEKKKDGQDIQASMMVNVQENTSPGGSGEESKRNKW
jgi:Ca-activated chloride channel homolog